MEARNAGKVLQILTSEETDEEKIAEDLKQLFTSNPGLLDCKLDDRGRNVFHYLVSFNMPKALRILLKEKDFHTTAAQQDGNGQTILHLAATDSTMSHDMAKIILEFFPHLLNIQDCQSNTALHLAVRFHLVWFVRLLADMPGLKRVLPNNQGETALTLAGESKDIRHALFSVDLSKIKTFGMRHTPTESMESLRGTFPLLTARSDSSLTPPSSSGSSSSSSPEDEMPEIKIPTRVRALNRDELINLICTLAIALRENKGSRIVEDLLNKIFLLSRECTFPEELKLSEALVKFGVEKDVVAKLLDFLSPRMEAETTALQDGMKQTIKKLAYHLTINGISEAPAPLGIYTANPNLEEAWWLVTCQDTANGNREFSYARIEDKVLGILTQHSVDEVFMWLRLLYSRFDHHQKLVANYVVAQLLLYAASGTGQDKLIASHFSFFIQFNIRRQHGLGFLGIEINEYLRKLFTYSLTLRNFRILKNALQSELKAKRSFTDLVESALSRSRREWTLEVHAIARELKMLSLAFYQQVLLNEFADCNWQSKLLKSELAPHITEFLTRSEKLRDYFMYTILNQPPKKIKKAFELLIDVMRTLFPLDEENYSDLHHTVFLYTIFIDSKISRLKKVLGSLSERDRKTVEELKQLTSEDGNYKFLRTINVVDNKALPFLMCFLKDVFLAHEATKELSQSQKAGAIGAPLSDLIKVKFAVSAQVVKHETDLPQFLRTYVKHKVAVFEAASHIHLPKEETDVSLPSDEAKTLRKMATSTQLPRVRSMSLDFSKLATVLTPDSKDDSSLDVRTNPKV